MLFLNCEKQHTKFFSDTNKLDSLLNIAFNSNDKALTFKLANTVYKEIDTVSLDTSSRKKLINLNRLYFYLDKKKQYSAISNLLISKPSSPIDHYEVGFCNYYLASSNYNAGNYALSFEQFKKAEKSFIFLQDLEYLGKAYIQKAEILLIKDAFVESEKNAVKALNIGLTIKNNLLTWQCYISLGKSLSGLKNYKKAITYYKKAHDLNETMQNDLGYNMSKAQILNYLAGIYQKQSNYKKAIEVAQQGLAIEDFTKTYPVIYCYLTNNLNYSKFKLGDKSAIKGFEETLKIGHSINSIVIQITSKIKLGEYHLAEKDTIKAIAYFENAKIQAHKNNIFEDELAILHLLAKAKPKAAANLQSRYIVLNDSLLNIERATRDKFSLIEQETDELKVEKNTAVAKVETRTNQIFFIVVIFVLISTIVFLWIKKNRQKSILRERIAQQEQKIVEQQKDIAEAENYQLLLEQHQKIEIEKNKLKVKISEEMHDNVLSKLSGIRNYLSVHFLMLEPEKYEIFEKQLDRMQEVEIDLRDITHDLQNNLFLLYADLVVIIKMLVEDFEKRTSIVFEFQENETINWEIVNIDIKINLYRVVQEALHNIQKYAQAKNVSIALQLLTPNQIQLSIVDDGIGFDSTLKKNGIGINNMQNRMQKLGGTFEIITALNSGTKINLTVPI